MFGFSKWLARIAKIPHNSIPYFFPVHKNEDRKINKELWRFAIIKSIHHTRAVISIGKRVSLIKSNLYLTFIFYDNPPYTHTNNNDENRFFSTAKLMSPRFFQSFRDSPWTHHIRDQDPLFYPTYDIERHPLNREDDRLSNVTFHEGSRKLIKNTQTFNNQLRAM